MKLTRNKIIAVAVVGTLSLGLLLFGKMKLDSEPINKPATTLQTNGGRNRNLSQIVRAARDAGLADAGSSKKSKLTDDEKRLLNFFCELTTKYPEFAGSGNTMESAGESAGFLFPSKFVEQLPSEAQELKDKVKEEKNLLDAILGKERTPQDMAWFLINLLEDSEKSDYPCNPGVIKLRIAYHAFSLIRDTMPPHEAVKLLAHLRFLDELSEESIDALNEVLNELVGDISVDQKYNKSYSDKEFASIAFQLEALYDKFQDPSYLGMMIWVNKDSQLVKSAIAGELGDDALESVLDYGATSDEDPEKLLKVINSIDDPVKRARLLSDNNLIRTAEEFKQIFEYLISDPASYYIVEEIAGNLRSASNMLEFKMASEVAVDDIVGNPEIKSFLEWQFNSNDLLRIYIAATFMKHFYYIDDFGKWLDIPKALNCNTSLTLLKPKISAYLSGEL